MVKLGIDAGNFKVKVAGEYGLLCFHSALGESREINLQQVHGEDDMIFEYEGVTGFAGSLALYESEFGGSLMGETKAHRDTKLRTLIAIHRYSTIYNTKESSFDIILGQPISTHKHNEKEKLKKMLRGEHVVTVNGVEKSFHINNVEICAECASSYWSNPKEGLVRIIDIGSGTVNYATILNQRFIDKDSNTIPFGVSTNKSSSLPSLVRGVATQTLKKWNQNDEVYVIGGIAEQMQPHLKEYFPNTEVLFPIYNQQYANPIFANAIAFYYVAVSIYE